MRIFTRLFGEKAKTLEQRAFDKGVPIIKTPLSKLKLDNYTSLLDPINGTGESKEQAEDNLLTNAREIDAYFLFDLKYNQSGRTITVSATGYKRNRPHPVFKSH